MHRTVCDFTQFVKMDFWQVHESSKSVESRYLTIKSCKWTQRSKCENEKKKVSSRNAFGFLLSWTCQKYNHAQWIILTV